LLNQITFVMRNLEDGRARGFDNIDTELLNRDTPVASALHAMQA